MPHPVVTRPLGALCLVLTSTLAGCAMRGPSATVASEPPAVYVDCRGPRTAAPTVILESGAFGAAADWGEVIDDLARGGRVCAYDRGGVGRSPPRAGGEDVTAITDELSRLLDRLGETRPVILVGHSNGALYAETFAARWPSRVAGLVYVNGVTSDDLDYPILIGDLTRERRLSNLAGVVADAGLARALAEVLTRSGGLTGDAAVVKRQVLSRPEDLRVARDEDRAILPGLTVARGLGGAPADIPTVAITGATDPDAPLSKAWRAAEAAPAERARDHWILYAPGATHTSPLARDRAYVVAAVDWLRSLPPRP
jgi:pimeloyl-ACP methyl ester carboxylesterase